jgi:hypothetical protein
MVAVVVAVVVKAVLRWPHMGVMAEQVLEQAVVAAEAVAEVKMVQLAHGLMLGVEDW